MGQLPLAPVNGEAQAAARTLSPNRMMDYPTLKATILNRVGSTPEGYRWKFREERFSPEEHPRTIAHRLNEYAMGWFKPDATTSARLVEVIVVERFLECLASEPQLWVQWQAPTTLDRAVALAEQYQAAKPTPSRLPGRSTAGSSTKGLGGRGVQGFGRGVGVESSRPRNRGRVGSDTGCCGVGPGSRTASLPSSPFDGSGVSTSC
ncbi:UNVERIFIED_CONTAM: hypothetical protein FKN15_038472 [Acipenser sinensis]